MIAPANFYVDGLSKGEKLMDVVSKNFRLNQRRFTALFLTLTI